ncbi:MAG TPA: xanthine dehydrogenase family protein subunit M [Thermomicrobiales bacterium]|mgnify:CR=1 FL=1|nr:xanthine dehydrogenase family protein subunit M [Thermomicrobiales bacterium]
MYPAQFAYERPTSVKDAIALLAADPDAKIIAGGHSLLPAMKLRLALPSTLVDIARIDELQGISVKAGAATIGSAATYYQIAKSADLQASHPVVTGTMHLVGDPHVRTKGTFGGALAHSDPAADMTAVFLVLNGSVTVQGPSGTRTIVADDLFVDLLTTSLEADEILTSISLPAMNGGQAAYEKHRHPASGYAVVGVAVNLTVAGGSISAARIAVTGATAKAERAAAAEAALIGKPATADTIAAAAAVAAEGLEVNGDVYASAEYRAHLITVLAKRALTRAAGL